MLRQRLSDALKEAMKARDLRSVSTIRLVLAQLKDRDIAARPGGNTTGIGEGEIEEMLGKMVKQRQESIVLYRQGNRPDLVQHEEEEIAIIERFMPKQLDGEERAAAIDAALAETGAQSLKDMGRVMALLKERFAGRLDFAKAGALVKQRLAK
ncbi:MAG TPA: GatB/YqeY domain-containing protein [Candidatus Udaeobacter sp.]|nr:GatB/YqeY domain-containing protein [Candidatus Udaeobacter sp.]